MHARRGAVERLFRVRVRERVLGEGERVEKAAALSSERKSAHMYE